MCCSLHVEALCVLIAILFMQGLTQVEEMLISGVLPIMSLYRSITSQTVWVQWSRHQPATRCCLLCHNTTTSTQ